MQVAFYTPSDCSEFQKFTTFRIGFPLLAVAVAVLTPEDCAAVIAKAATVTRIMTAETRGPTTIQETQVTPQTF